MSSRLLVPALILLCAGCAETPARTPVSNSTPNGDVIQRSDRSAPDTPVGKKPASGYRDQAVDTDPASPRTRDTGQKVEVPVRTQ